MKLMVLDKNDKWETHMDKVNEESRELIEAIKEGNMSHIAEEVLDNIQVSIGILDKLYNEGLNIEEVVHIHNRKLVNRGWKHKAAVRVQVNKK
ncbi:MazG nucleotide pyrophosphohydrolase domain-containing protein [Clostridium sp. AWRP]|uniref:MazG nucleotide pyrophosphohydrolase domain-containing protein n=1 Tax=Clostridium sp. AWRP TaxID=2212991 RepID=UPI000FDA37E1|nr:MazG nucleotide pyrophosphohydrolase domain-containing protein [Clostridium sp. AWRP]AZV56784.1 hypothetical protein DMR38_09320 [Clostridium sp. AWRP]